MKWMDRHHGTAVNALFSILLLASFYFLLWLGGVIGCSAVDDFGRFSQVANEREDGGASDAGAADLAHDAADMYKNADLVEHADLATATKLDLAPTPDLVPACASTLSGVGADDFTISFTVTAMPEPARYQPFASQRDTCGVDRDFWAVGMAPDGTLLVQLNATAVGLVNLPSKALVDDGSSHGVVVQRVGGVLSLTIDGKADAATAFTAALGALPVLEVAQAAYCGLGSAAGAQVTDVCLNTP